MTPCATPYCRTKCKRKHCHKCRSRRYALKHPFRYHYNAQKQNAKRRGHEFKLTFEEYKEIWKNHPKKWKEKCKPGLCRWHMDRIDPRRGYEKENVQILDKTRNVEKYHTEDKFLLQVNWKHQKPSGLEKAPF